MLKIFSSKTFILLFISILIFNSNVSSQSFDNAGSYMNYMGQQYRKITEDFWSYSSAVAHGKSARKVENRRQSLLQTVKDAQKKIAEMPPYSSDKSLRDSASAFLKISYHVLNDDYGKIINMEEVSEQSYDAMEAYLLAQDLANAKLKEAGDRLNLTEKEFAANHKVNLVDNEKDALDLKVKEANKVAAYHRIVYLIFFKSYKQELYLMDALNKKNIAGIEQNRNTLLKYTEEGISKLDTMKAYNGDKSLIVACRQVLDFYKKECKEKFDVVTNFLLKEENFQKTKKAFEAKKESERKQDDVDQYNKSIKEFNQGVSEYNGVNNELNQNRKTVLDNYNKTSSTFLDKHTPKYK
jgi:hypothetical protein